MKTEHIRIAAKYLRQQDSQFAQDLGIEVEAERQALWDAADAEWNAAIEAAADAIMCGCDSCDICRASERIRALKRGDAARPTPDDEGLWDIIRELKERPCEHGNDCRTKVEYMHPCLPCAARIEWEAK